MSQQRCQEATNCPRKLSQVIVGVTGKLCLCLVLTFNFLILFTSFSEWCISRAFVYDTSASLYLDSLQLHFAALMCWVNNSGRIKFNRSLNNWWCNAVNSRSHHLLLRYRPKKYWSRLLSLPSYLDRQLQIYNLVHYYQCKFMEWNSHWHFNLERALFSIDYKRIVYLSLPFRPPFCFYQKFPASLL